MLGRYLGKTPAAQVLLSFLFVAMMALIYASWASVRDAWDFANRVRTIPSLLAFVLQTMALFDAR